MVYAIETGFLFIDGLHHPPRRLRYVGALNHGFFGLRIGFPALAAFQVHGTEFPLL